MLFSDAWPQKRAQRVDLMSRCSICSGKIPAEKTGFHVLHPFVSSLVVQAARPFKLVDLVAGNRDQGVACAA